MPPKFQRRVDPERRELLTPTTSSDEEGSARGRAGLPRRNDTAVKKVQHQLDDVVDIMHKNIERVVERGEKLEDLQDKSEDLADSAAAFRTQARRIQRQMWWKRCRVTHVRAGKSLTDAMSTGKSELNQLENLVSSDFIRFLHKSGAALDLYLQP